ncbi:MAG: 30S ribosome-binding factor RbfA [Ruminococcaceae bacterium]|nr:30S ribosome-binding factor RbfA [Oscillospiraceae bacterium]
MPRYRRNRINESVTEEVSAILREVKDPRVAGALMTITGSDVTADLKFAKIYYSVYGEFTEEEEKELKKGLRSVSSFIRSQLAQRLNLRITPELSFIRDNGVKHGADIAAILKTLEDKRTDTEVQEEEDDDE